MRSVPLLAALAVMLAPAAGGAQTLGTTRVASGLNRPVQAVSAPADEGRLFVPELGGTIRLIKDGVLLARPFLDLSADVLADSAHGLLALVFDPQYAATGRLYVLYTRRPDRAPRLVRYRRGAGPDIADPGSADVIMTWPRGAEHHTGGWLGFGPDGFLYVSMGDGGGQMDPGNLAQNLEVPWGKILRLDVSRDGFPQDPERNYAIPADNPFRGRAGLDEIWAYGLRNPWRCAFDRETGDLWIGDVGQGAREEIDFVKAGTPGGLNFGWKVMEGTACFSPSTGCNRTGLVLPVRDYGRAEGRSVTGGFVYRGQAIPGLRGTYFYGDYETSKVWTFRLDPTGRVVEHRDRTEELQPREGALRRVVSFGEDAAGELYVVDFTGAVFRIHARGTSLDGGARPDAATDIASSRGGDAAGAAADAPPVEGGAGGGPRDAAIGGADASEPAPRRPDATPAPAPAPLDAAEPEPPARATGQERSAGCGCRLGGVSGAAPATALPLALAGILIGRRRRRPLT